MGIEYVGRLPDRNYSVVHKKYVDDWYAQHKVTEGFVESETKKVTDTLAFPDDYIEADKDRASMAEVDAADENYLHRDLMGQPDGVATIDKTGAQKGYITSSQLPLTLDQSREPIFVPGVIDRKFTGKMNVSNEDQEITWAHGKEVLAAELTITDPGFPYVPLPFVSIWGGAVDKGKGPRSRGTGTYGRVTVWNAVQEDPRLYLFGICGDQKTYAYHTIPPYCPVSTDDGEEGQPYAVNGDMTLRLWLTLWATGTASPYQFLPDDLNFYALVYPSFLHELKKEE